MIKKEMAGELLDRFLTGMQELGIEEQDIVSIVTDALAENGQEGRRHMSNILELNQVNKTYGRKQALHNVSLNIAQDEL